MENEEQRNKHENSMLRKKYKKRDNYRCCHSPTGNCNKIARGHCCTYPQVYKRRTISVINSNVSKMDVDEIMNANY